MNKQINWSYPSIGTCGEPIDTLRVSIDRTRYIPDILLRFDGNRDGYVIGGSFWSEETNDFEFREVAFIPESLLDDEEEPAP